jgi:hypothetical protein
MMIEPRFRGCRVIDMTRAQPSGSLGRFLVGQWLPAIERTVRATTFINYRGHVERHLVPHLGAVPLGELTGTVINKIYADLLVSGKIANRRPLSPTRVRRIHATLHRALRDGSVGAYSWTIRPTDAIRREQGRMKSERCAPGMPVSSGTFSRSIDKIVFLRCGTCWR